MILVSILCLCNSSAVWDIYVSAIKPDSHKEVHQFYLLFFYKDEDMLCLATHDANRRVNCSY